MLIFYVGVFVYFSLRQYFYINEYLEVLYIGCEDFLESNSIFFEFQEYQEIYLEEQRKLFLFGNEILFVSFFDNYDVRREIERDIQIYV